MGINVSTLDSRYDFEIDSASYIGRPADNTVMYVTAKVGSLIENLRSRKNCLIFAEQGIDVPIELQERNCFVLVENPQLAYLGFVRRLADIRDRRDRERKYTLTEGGYYIGENVKLGANACIEPNCLIGHDVVIGDNCRILAGAVIKNAVIGDNFIAYENSVVGNYTFTFAVDENGNKQRIPSMGKAIIGNNVELGCHSTISAGSTGNTVVEDYVKTAACVHIAHDCHVKKNAELISGTVLGGFSVIGEGAVLGLNATVKNRVSLGDRVIVGMGSAVLREVPEDVTVVGSPARILGKN